MAGVSVQCYTPPAAWRESGQEGVRSGFTCGLQALWLLNTHRYLYDMQQVQYAAMGGGGVLSQLTEAASVTSWHGPSSACGGALRRVYL
jgi:hypothetical protein